MKKKKIQNYVIQLNKELGEGSFGKVYMASKEPNKDIVAAKVIAKEKINGDEYVKETLISQIRVMRQLNSEWIVSLKDVLQTANNYYIVQEYCDGGTLRSHMKKIKPMSEPEAIEILTQICRGFTELLKNGIIHRDVKPQNILIHNGRFKIADFGFAKNVKTPGQLNKSLVGTPLYMSPQVLRMEKYSTKCDIWAIGMIFFEMVCGEVPWPAKSQFELINSIESKPIHSIKKTEMSSHAKSFAQGCLRINEKDRFGWKEVFSHPIFEGKFKQLTEVAEKLERKANFIINQLRMKIHCQNIDLEKLFTKLKFSRDSSLNLDELLKLLKTLDSQIEREEAQYILQLLDTDKSGTIEFEEFRSCLSKNGVRMQAYVPQLTKENSSVEPDENAPNKKVMQAIIKLKMRVDEFKVDLHTIYSLYDKNNDKTLSMEEFRHLISRIDKNLTEEDFLNCFKIFDINEDEQISYDEFFRTLCKIAGEPYVRV